MITLWAEFFWPSEAFNHAHRSRGQERKRLDKEGQTIYINSDIRWGGKVARGASGRVRTERRVSTKYGVSTERQTGLQY